MIGKGSAFFVAAFFVALCVQSAGAQKNTAAAAAREAVPSHALSLYGDIKYPENFSNFDYVNPDAPKGGTLIQSAAGSFDTLNPFTLRGIPPAGAAALMYDTLMAPSDDEPFTQYALIAEKVAVPTDRSYAIFYINPKAAFHDGSPVTAEDVAFSFTLLTTQGSPAYRQYYAAVSGVQVLSPRAVKFTFSERDNLELPLIVGQLAVLSKKYWEGKDFSKTTFDIPTTSGPYAIQSFKPGSYVEYARVKNYWAADLPVNRGKNNFDRIRFEYYRDQDIARQAFLAGEYYLHNEYIARAWATGYDAPAVRRGEIKKEIIPDHLPTGMQAFVFNTRTPLFADARVRRALQYAVDFQWLNSVVFYGAYERAASYFDNSELASFGLPREGELDILTRFKASLPPELFTHAYLQADYDRPGEMRRVLRESLDLLEQAGWVLQDQKLIHKKTRAPFRFTVLLRQANFDKITLMMQRRLRQLGIEMDVRTVDAGQWVNRVQAFDFDMTTIVFPQSLSPSNEQRNFWGSGAAARPGSYNFAGINDPTIDALIDLLIASPDRQTLVQRARALDRALLWGFYVIPQWRSSGTRTAYWDIFGRPETLTIRGSSVMTWWIDPDKARALGKGGY